MFKFRRVSLMFLFLLLPLSSYALDFEIEPNNNPSEASSIILGKSVHGNVGSVTDIDYFQILSSTSGSLRLFFWRNPSNYAYNVAKIRVLNSLQTELASLDIYAPDEYSTIDVGVEADKEYLIEVSGCPSSDTGSDCFRQRSELYELTIVQLSNPFFETESNNTPESADSVAVNSWIFGQHSSQADLDYFRIEVPSAGDLFVQVSRPSDNYLYSLGNIAVVAPGGALLNSDDIYAPDGIGRVVLGISSPGEIFLRLTSCEGGSRCEITSSDQYQVITSFVPDLPCDIVFQNGFECKSNQAR